MLSDTDLNSEHSWLLNPRFNICIEWGKKVNMFKNGLILFIYVFETLNIDQFDLVSPFVEIIDLVMKISWIDFIH